MNVVSYRKHLPVEDPECLIDAVIERPVPGARDVLVEVRAISVNPVDTKVRRGGGPAQPLPADGELKVLGWDAAGVVVAVGAEVTLFAPGDEVYYAGALERPGSYAELQVVDERSVGRKPKGLSFAEAAALPLTTITAWELLFDRFKLPISAAASGALSSAASASFSASAWSTSPPSISSATSTAASTLASASSSASALSSASASSSAQGAILIIGGAGGVGSIAIQLAKRLTGLRVIATASRPETVAWCREMGADEVIDHRQPLGAQVRKLVPAGVNYVLALTKTEDHFEEILEAVAGEAAIGLIENVARPVDLNRLKPKCLSLHWEFMFARARPESPKMAEQGRLLNAVAALVDAGEIRSTAVTHLGAINAANLRQGHALVESGRAVGKVVLEGF